MGNDSDELLRLIRLLEGVYFGTVDNCSYFFLENGMHSMPQSLRDNEVSKSKERWVVVVVVCLRTLQNDYIEMLATVINTQDLSSTKESIATPPYSPVNHGNDDDNDNLDNHDYYPCLFHVVVGFAFTYC